MYKQISVLGCGWLGFPLAKHLIALGYTINGSSTSPDKMDVLKENNINPFLIEVNENEVIGNMSLFLEGSDILIINVPPQRKLNLNNYQLRLENLLLYIKQSNIKHILFVSSTSAYAHQKELITEDTIAKPDSKAGQDILAAEQMFQNLSTQKTTVLRLAGLIGEDRHPVYFLAGRKDLPNPHHAVNLIHLDECIKIMTKIIQTDSWGEVFIGVDQQHLDRKTYYTQQAINRQLPIPHFEENSDVLDKKIDNPLTKEKLL